MKVCAYVPLLYGKEYLEYSIRSYMDVVDKIYILYTDKPSYGHNSGFVNTESEQELKDIVFSTTNKAEWIKVDANNEGAHRGHISQFSRNYDMTVSTDYDEVWKTEDLERALKQAYDMPYRRYGIAGFLNFFRDFNNVCTDGFRPHRIYKESGNGEYLNLEATIYHFGYAISEASMRGKWACHGHHDELRPNWINEVYLNPNVTTNLHPVAHGIWNLHPFDKYILPQFMHKHPLFLK